MSDEIILAQALFNALGKMVSTKSTYNMRFDDDQNLLELYESTGAKTFDRRINGVKVGTSTIKVEPEKSKFMLNVVDQDAFEKWLLETGMGRQEIVYNEQEIFDYFTCTGEEPAGARIGQCIIPEHVTGTTLRIDTQKVFDVMEEKLPQNVMALLEQGEEE